MSQSKVTTPAIDYRETNMLAHGEGEQALGLAIEAVVAAMSESVLRDLMETLIGETIANGGDGSTFDQFEAVMDVLERRPVFCYKPDPIFVRAVCCAAAVTSLTMMSNAANNGLPTRLAQAVVLRQMFEERIL